MFHVLISLNGKDRDKNETVFTKKDDFYSVPFMGTRPFSDATPNIYRYAASRSFGIIPSSMESLMGDFI